jgi:hypothetical protein
MTLTEASGPWEALAQVRLVNNRVNLLLLDELTADGLKTNLSTRGERTMGRHLVHVYEVHPMRVEHADKALANLFPRVMRTDRLRWAVWAWNYV